MWIRRMHFLPWRASEPSASSSFVWPGPLLVQRSVYAAFKTINKLYFKSCAPGTWWAVSIWCHRHRNKAEEQLATHALSDCDVAAGRRSASSRMSRDLRDNPVGRDDKLHFFGPWVGEAAPLTLEGNVGAVFRFELVALRLDLLFASKNCEEI